MASKLLSVTRAGRLRDLLLVPVALAVPFLLMAYRGRIVHGALWGGLGLLVALLAVLRALGLLAAQSEESLSALPDWRSTSLAALPGERSWLAPPVAAPVALLALLLGVALPAHLPLAWVVALLALLPAALRRPGLLLVVIVGLLYLPGLGAFGLWDPWETHYGEVAREILARTDWISLWWAQDGWFWSKPILIFWAEALAWSASGLDFRPDRVANHVEWVIRFPVCMLSMLALVSVYHAIKALWGARQGLCCGLVLATAPFFALLSHQAITDMYFVANMTVAMACLIGAVTVDDDAVVRRLRVGGYVVSAQHAVIGLLFMVAMPQVLYLVSRNVSLLPSLSLAFHPDEFIQGSAGNADVPGNGRLLARRPVFALEPSLQALAYLVALVAVFWSLRREERARPLLMVTFYAFCALAFMGKGIPGFALPGLIAGLWLLIRNRWQLLLRGELGVTRGALIVALLGLPWFVAEFVRQGTRFTDRILVHDHLNRLTLGVHGDTGSVQYFITQLGYGMFPWVALAPLAVAAVLVYSGKGHASRVSAQRQDAVLLLGLWFGVAFTLFSAMTTKFHHYIFPAVPPAALLVGLGLCRLMGEPRRLEPDAAPGAFARRLLPGAACILVSTCVLIVGLGGLRGQLRGAVPTSVAETLQHEWILQHGMPPWMGLLWVAAGLVLLVWSAVLQRDLWRLGDEVEADGGVALSASLLLGVMLVAFVGRDLSWFSGERPAGNELLIQLFIYKYDRPFPPDFDYRPLWTGVASTAVVMCLVGVFRRWRAVAAQGLLAVAVVFCGLTLNLYMRDLAPHWSQQGLVQRYYAERSSPDEPLVAWQMNWKGENFYSGNRVAVFQSLDNKKISEYLEANAGKRAFFLLEHKRFPRFEKLLSPRKVTPMSTEHDNNKFVLVRAML